MALLPCVDLPRCWPCAKGPAPARKWPEFPLRLEWGVKGQEILGFSSIAIIGSPRARLLGAFALQYQSFLAELPMKRYDDWRAAG